MKYVFIFLLFTCCHGMSVVIDINTLDFNKYFNADKKELNLSNMPLGDVQLKEMEPRLKEFINNSLVARLIVENANLETVPYSLIGFALTCKSLNFVSFLNNNFIKTVVSINDASVLATEAQPGFLEAAITTMWGVFSPEIEKAIA
jgi:hypothetical protein